MYDVVSYIFDRFMINGKKWSKCNEKRSIRTKRRKKIIRKINLNILFYFVQKIRDRRINKEKEKDRMIIVTKDVAFSIIVHSF